MEGKQIIGIDFDDTIVNYVERWIEVFNRETGKKVSFNDVKAWRLFELFSDVIDEKKMNEFFAKTWKEEYENIRLVDPLLPKVFADLYNDFSLYVITASFASDMQIEGLLKRNNVKYDKIVHVRSHEDKLSDKIRIYVDDNPVTAKEFSEEGKYIVLFDRPWNRDVKENGRIKRAATWTEAARKIKEFASY